MSSEILGMVGTKEVSETRGSLANGVIDTDYLTRFARAHEAAGFDRVLIGYGATGPDGFAIAAHVLHVTTKLKVLIAHRPGFVVPTLVARKLATLDHLSGGGRVGIHHITGGDERDQKRDGDFLDHDQRYVRTEEFIKVLRQTWNSAEPFNHEGEIYHFENAFSSVKPVHPDGIRVFFGGASPAAVKAGAAQADVYMLWGEPRAQIAERIALVRAEAAKHGREVSFSMSVRPIVADSEDEAWARAERIREATTARLEDPNGLYRLRRAGRQSSSVGAARLQSQAREQEVHDERLWFGVTALVGPGGNSTALVGTAEQVAESLQKYRDLGVSTFLIRGFDPLGDVVYWGRRLVPLLRQQVDTASESVSASVA